MKTHFVMVQAQIVSSLSALMSTVNTVLSHKVMCLSLSAHLSASDNFMICFTLTSYFGTFLLSVACPQTVT